MSIYRTRVQIPVNRYCVEVYRFFNFYGLDNHVAGKYDIVKRNFCTSEDVVCVKKQ